MGLEEWNWNKPGLELDNRCGVMRCQTVSVVWWWYTDEHNQNCIMVNFSEICRGWKTLLGLILVYTFGYPPTIVVVMTSLISAEYNNKTLSVFENQDFTHHETQKAVIISVFTIFMNSVPLCLNFVSTTTIKIAIFATCLQIVGLLLCYLTISSSWVGILLGFGVLVGSGIGLHIVNILTVACRAFPTSLTLACGKSLIYIFDQNIPTIRT